MIQLKNLESHVQLFLIHLHNNPLYNMNNNINIIMSYNMKNRINHIGFNNRNKLNYINNAILNTQYLLTKNTYINQYKIFQKMVEFFNV